MDWTPEDKDREPEDSGAAADNQEISEEINIDYRMQDSKEHGIDQESEEVMPDIKSRSSEERTVQVKRGKKRGSGFGTGFLAGFLTALALVIVFMLGWILGESGLLDKKSEEPETELGAAVLTDTETLYKLMEVQEIIEDSYLNEIDSEELATYLFKGVAAGLDDPYANYYSTEELQSVLDSSSGEYYGIGATLSIDLQTGEIHTIQVYEGSPAERGGLQEGDIWQTVEGEAVTGKDLTELVSEIKSMKQAFTVEVYRADSEELVTLTLECGEVEIHHVEYEMLENQVGYIQITEFTTSAVGQFESAVKDLNSQGMVKLVVDLRNNPGGLLTSVCDILDQVLPKDSMIVYTEDNKGRREEYHTDGEQIVTCEIAVLVNGYSASASEIFAGAVQDYELGPVVGMQTYGKGVVQKTYPLSDGSAFKLTVEKYFTPNGQDIDGNGITPDIIIEETEQQDAAEEARTESENESEQEAAAEENPESAEDIVLQHAVESLLN